MESLGSPEEFDDRKKIEMVGQLLYTKKENNRTFRIRKAFLTLWEKSESTEIYEKKHQGKMKICSHFLL